MVSKQAFERALDVLHRNRASLQLTAEVDPVALGQAIRSVLTQPRLAASMAAEARRLAPGLSWPAVARRYCVLADQVVATRESVTT